VTVELLYGIIDLTIAQMHSTADHVFQEDSTISVPLDKIILMTDKNYHSHYSDIPQSGSMIFLEGGTHLTVKETRDYIFKEIEKSFEILGVSMIDKTIGSNNTRRKRRLFWIKDEANEKKD